MSESIYGLVGGAGYYQIFHFIWITYFQINCGLNILIPIFINNYQDLHCKTQVNHTDQFLDQFRDQFKGYDNITGSLIIDSFRCNYRTVSSICSEIILRNTPMTSTVRSQYHLYCEYHGLSSLAVSMFMVGIFFGSIFGGIFSDSFGRVAGCFLSYTTLSVAATVSAVSPWYWLHVVARTLTGFACSVSFVANTGLLLEITELKIRTFFGFGYSIGYDLGYGVLVIMAYFIRDHFQLQITVSCMSYIALVFPFLYKESFRWLLVKHKYEKAKKVILFIAKCNKKNVKESQVDKAIEQFEIERKDTIKRASIKEIFKYKVVIVNLLILWYIYFSCSFSYYTFVLGSSKISNRLYVSTIISAAAAIITKNIYLVLCAKVKRIYILLSLQLGVASCFIVGIILKYYLGIKSIITTMSFTISIALSITNFGFMWVYGGEAFPTVIRGTSISIGSAFARVSGMIASQMEWVFEVSPNALPILGALMAVFGSLLTFFILPETFKHPSLDFLSQAEKYFVEWRQPWRNKSEKKSDIEMID